MQKVANAVYIFGTGRQDPGGSVGICLPKVSHHLLQLVQIDFSLCGHE